MAWIEKYTTKKGEVRRRVRWRGSDGKKSRSTGALADTAKTVRNNIESGLVLNEFNLPDLKRSLSSAVKEYLTVYATMQKPKATNIAEWALSTLEAGFPPEARLLSIKSEHMVTFRESLLLGVTKRGKPRKRNGVKLILRNCKTFFKYCVTKKWIKENPAEKVDEKLAYEKVARFLSNEEVARLLQACRFNEEGLREIIIFALHSGMREGEILSLRPRDVQLNKIYVENTKTGKPRNVPIHPFIAPLMPRLLSVLPKWSVSRLCRAFGRAANRANLKPLRFHDLRHTFCSNYLKNGGTLADLMKITGHESLAAVEIYTHFQPTYLEDRVAKVSYDFDGAKMGHLNENGMINANYDNIGKGTVN